MCDLVQKITFNLNFDVYRALPAVNASTLKAFAQAPILGLHEFKGAPQRKLTPTLRVGSCFHGCMDNTADAFYRVADDTAQRNSMAKHFGDARVVTAAEMAKAKAWKAAALRDEDAAFYYRNSAKEVTATWQDAETGLWCKARSDAWWMDGAVLIDWKTTEDASPQAFARAIWEYKYHWQAAHYMDGWAACGHPVEQFVFVAVEKAFPHPVGVYVLSKKALERGRADVRAWLSQWKECVSTGKWDGGYTSRGTIEIDLPNFAYN